MLLIELTNTGIFKSPNAIEVNTKKASKQKNCFNK